MLIDNIISQADVIEQQEYRLFLCKPNKEIVREITKQAFNKRYQSQLGGADKFSFSIYKEYDGEEFQHYDMFKGKALILVKQRNIDIGYFQIDNPSKENDGVSERLDVECLSAEVKLMQKKMFLTEGVFRVYDQHGSQGILNIVKSIAPSWDVGYVDFTLLNKVRYFDIVDSNIYDILINKVQEVYECVFEFNTVNNTIDVYALENYGNETNIILSLNNLLDKTKEVEMSDDIVTRLHLFGANELTVRDINFGNTFIQNFDYFKSTDFMTQGLINALNSYESLVASKQSEYSNYLAQLQHQTSLLVTARTDLHILQEELKTLEKNKAYLQSLGQPTTTVQIQINNKNSQISTKQSQINSITNTINSIYNAIDSLMVELNLSNNLSQAQIKELDNFVIEDSYQTDAFLVTENMSYDERISIKTQLLEAGSKILARCSYPRYKIDIDMADFLKLPEYAPWWSQLKIGDTLTIQTNEGYNVGVRITSFSHNWDGNSLRLQIGSRYGIDDDAIDLLELIQGAISTSTSVDFKKFQFEQYSSDRNEVLEFINSSIDINRNEIISGEDVGIHIDGSGILATALDPNTGLVSPRQLRISNNAIVLSDDGFHTAKTAIGRLANGMYGIAAEVVAGKMILGNNMIIETGNGDFRVDGSGVNITKLALNMVSSDNLKRITLDPNVGIRVSTRNHPTHVFSDMFFINANNNRLTFRGTLEGADGSFSGSLSASTITGSTISGGNITGTNISGGNITGTNITGTTISGTNINGGTITGAVLNGGSLSVGSGGNDLFIGQDGQSGIIRIGEWRITGQYGGLWLGQNNAPSFLSAPHVRLGNLPDSSVRISANNIQFSTTPNVSGEPLVGLYQLDNVISNALDPYATMDYVDSWIGSLPTHSYVNSYAVRDFSSQGIEMQLFPNHLEVRLSGGAWKTIPLN